MTLKELKDLFYELKKIKSQKEAIFSNDELSIAQMKAEYEIIKPREEKLEEMGIPAEEPKAEEVATEETNHLIEKIFKGNMKSNTRTSSRGKCARQALDMVLGENFEFKH